MADQVIVVRFPEPLNTVALGIIIGKVKDSFKDFPGVKIYLGQNDSAERIIDVVEGKKLNGSR